MATEKRLIRLDHALQSVSENYRSDMSKHELDMLVATRKRLKSIPTVDAVEVVHGEWSRLEDDYCGITALVCSECNREYWFEDEPPMKIYNYCPNCGAKMDGDGNG